MGGEGRDEECCPGPGGLMSFPWSGPGRNPGEGRALDGEVSGQRPPEAFSLGQFSLGWGFLIKGK